MLCKLQRFYNRCGTVTNVNVLRGIEGEASAAWFEFSASYFCLHGSSAVAYAGLQRTRSMQLLSLGYTLLLQRTLAACEAVGLDAALGSLHEYHPGRPSLACDLMEPLRVPAVDRWVIALCNQHRIAQEDFTSEGRGVRLRKDVFPQVLADWETAWYKMSHEDYLISTTEAYVQQVRRLARPLPIAQRREKKAVGSGNDAKVDKV